MRKDVSNLTRRTVIKSVGAAAAVSASGLMASSLAAENSSFDLTQAPPSKPTDNMPTPFKGYYVFASDPRAKLPGYISMPG